MYFVLLKKMSHVKEKLFSITEVTDVLIWNHIMGADLELVKKQHLVKYLIQNKAKFTQIAIDLFFFQYSTKKHQYLTKREFIDIFVDNSQKFINEIMRARNSKHSFAKNHVPHFKITDLLVQILVKTLEFLQLKEKMKQNIFAQRQQSELNFNLKEVDPNHFLIFMNPYQPTWLQEQCEIVLRHIMKSKEKSLKEFYFFFVPLNCKSKQLNPDKIILKKTQSLEIKQTYSSMVDHRKASHFGNKPQKLRKTLYLK